MSRFTSTTPSASKPHSATQLRFGKPYHLPQIDPVAQPSNYYLPPPPTHPTDLLVQRIMDAITPVLNNHQAGTLTRMEVFEKNIRDLLQPVENNVKNVEQSQVSIEKTIFESNCALQQTLVSQAKALKGLLNRVNALEVVIGKHRDGDRTGSIVDKLDAVNYSMGEFLERSWDPCASIDPVQKHDVGTSPMRQPRPLTPSEPDSSRSSSFNSFLIRATREDKTPQRDSSECSTQQAWHEMDVSPIKAVNPKHVYHENGTSPGRLAITIPAWLKHPNASKIGDSDANAVSQSPQSSINSFSLTAVDWNKPSPADPSHVASAQVDFFTPDLSLERYGSLPTSGRTLRVDTTQPAGSPVEMLSPRGVQSSQTPSSAQIRDVPFPTPPKDNSPIASTGTTVMNDHCPMPPSQNLLVPDKTATMVSSRTVPGSSSSVIDEASVLQMVNYTGSSLHDTPSSKFMVLDTDVNSHDHDDCEPPGLSHSTAATSESASALAISSGSTSLSAVSASFFSAPIDELSDLTSISDSNSDVAKSENLDVERPRKRPRLNRQASMVKQLKVKLEKPFPRKRDRPSKATVSAVSGSVGGSSKIKQRSGKKKKSVNAWPDKKLNAEGSCGTVIQCDICRRWYHCGCVGFAADDPALDTLDIFKCPPCVIGMSLSPNEQEKCSRPDCTETAGEDIFFVERIIGRRIKIEGGVGRKRLWLVKWLNYPVYRATWEGDDSINGNHKLIDNFIEDLKSEGIEDDISSTLLLQEATDGGWNCDEPDTIPLGT